MYYEDEFEDEIDYKEYLASLNAIKLPEEMRNFCRDMYTGDPWILNLPRYIEVSQMIITLLSVIQPSLSKILYLDSTNPSALLLRIDAKSGFIKDIKVFVDVLQRANGFFMERKSIDRVILHILFQDVYIPVK